MLPDKIRIILEQKQLPEHAKSTVALNQLGVTNASLLEESLRYALVHGDNYNYVEVDFPVDELENSAIDILTNGNEHNLGYDDLPREHQESIDSVVKKSFTLAVDNVIGQVAALSNVQGIRELHNGLVRQHGDRFNVVIESITPLLNTANMIVDIKIVNEE